MGSEADREDDGDDGDDDGDDSSVKDDRVNEEFIGPTVVIAAAAEYSRVAEDGEEGKKADLGATGAIHD